MKKVLKQLIVFILSLVVVVQMWGCSQSGLDELSKTITSYNITATLNDTDKTITASQMVSYVNESKVELSQVWFNLYPAAYRKDAKVSPIELRDFSEAYPNGASYGGIEINGVTVDGKTAVFEIGGEDANALIVNLSSPLLPTARVSINLDYTVTLANIRHRLGFAGGTINLGNWYPVACIYEDGAFKADPYYSSGDPFYLTCANFNVSITAPKKYVAAMSGGGKRTENGENATTVSSIKAARDFAMVLGEFKSVSGKADGVNVTYYYYNDVTAESSLKAAIDSIQTFSSKFGAYPYTEYSVVQTSFLAGGMEYSSLVYISDEAEGELYRDVIIHETAHQWWFGLVGNDQISNAWLDEALTEFTTSLFYDLRPEYNVKYNDRIGRAASNYVTFCEVNSLGLDTSMNRRVNEYRSGLEYAFMTYVKGQLMFDALRKSIGDDALIAGLKNYCESYSYKIARPDDLIACFEKSSKTQLKSFFTSWVDGKVQIFG